MNSSQGTKRKSSIKEGNAFALGEHRLLCGDATNASAIDALFGRHKADLILTDPPYGVDYVASKEGFAKLKTRKTIKNDGFQSDEKYRAFTRAWLTAALPHLARKNAAYIFNSDKMVFALREGMRDAGFTFAQLLIWAKTAAVVGRMDYLGQHELIAYGWRGVHAFRKAKDKSVLVCPRPRKSALHPTMKPVSLLRRLVLNSTKISGTVYDPFAGSGSTLIACEQTKRRCFSVEIDPEYCDAIIGRWERLTGERVKRLR